MWIWINFHQSFEKCSILTPDISKQPHTSLESLRQIEGQQWMVTRGSFVQIMFFGKHIHISTVSRVHVPSHGEVTSRLPWVSSPCLISTITLVKYHVSWNMTHRSLLFVHSVYQGHFHKTDPLPYIQCLGYIFLSMMRWHLDSWEIFLTMLYFHNYT